LSPTRSSANGAPDDESDRPVAVESGATAEEGQLVCVIEAMKMENGITRSPSARPSRRATRSS
jgi:biotin carboxyl carrier protein